MPSTCVATGLSVNLWDCLFLSILSGITNSQPPRVSAKAITLPKAMLCLEHTAYRMLLQASWHHGPRNRFLRDRTCSPLWIMGPLTARFFHGNQQDPLNPFQEPRPPLYPEHLCLSSARAKLPRLMEPYRQPRSPASSGTHPAGPQPLPPSMLPRAPLLHPACLQGPPTTTPVSTCHFPTGVSVTHSQMGTFWPWGIPVFLSCLPPRP